MIEIIPFKTRDEALQLLDNGGRFFNVFTKADDGEINLAEIAKVAGVFDEKQQLVLFLELSISLLTMEEQLDIISRLDDDLRKFYLKYKPQVLMPSEVETRGGLGINTIISGSPQVKRSNTEFDGFIMIPIFTGKVMSFMSIPLMEQYDVYELFDEGRKSKVVIAHYKGKGKLPLLPMKVGGNLKDIEVEIEGKKGQQKFLEISYYQLL